MTNSERRVGLVRRALDPPGEALPDWEIWARLGRALCPGEHFAWSSAAEVYGEYGRARAVPGAARRRCRRRCRARCPCAGAPLRSGELPRGVGGDDGRAQARAALQPGGAAGALAGENGAGKTTLVKLLTGMYQPTSGRIRLDGTPLTEIDPSAWRERTAATFQDFVEFELVALEVVGIADLGRIDDAGAVAHSGGQWQRLALARRMMRLAPLLLRITEHGTHQQLMANRGLYSQLYEM